MQASLSATSSPVQRVHQKPQLRRRNGVIARAAVEVVERTELGKSGVQVSTCGLGAWSWGDRSGYWGYGQQYQKVDNYTAYEATMKAGITFIDTAEVYGFGKSEEYLGDFIREGKGLPMPEVATKFAPLPWKFGRDDVVAACKASLARLRQDRMALYMQHWPAFGPNFFRNDAFVEGLGDCWEQGLCQAVGVSNFNASRVRSAAKALEARGTCLASNQVQYSLIYRAPETNGVLEACREAGTTLVAYSPLCQGLLTGKYNMQNKPVGPRAALFTEARYKSVEALLDLMDKVGQEHGGKTKAQVAINWCLSKGALPIPGAKNAKQVEEIAGALGWRLREAEVAELDALSSKIPSSTGAPFENW